MNKLMLFIKKNFSNIFFALILIFFIYTGKFQVLSEKVKSYFGEGKGLVAENIELKKVGSDEIINLAGMKNKTVLVNFWATWCPPCRMEIPSLIELNDKYSSNGFEVIGISLDQEGEDIVKPFLTEFKINYPVVMANQKIIDNFGEIPAVPTSFLLKNGIVERKYVGYHLQSTFEAAFRAIRKASELIDMSKHSGEHPRMGATDVCPLIPVSGISMEETVEYARKLGERVAKELNIPVFLYESAASRKERKNLATVRSGEYEGLEKKLKKEEWKPDFGEAIFNAKSGATAIGVRDFLLAYNVNLNTKSTRKANSVAFDVREQGRVKRIGNPISGEIERDENGNPLRIPGSLKAVKAIGWFIDEYDIAQISMNLVDYKVTPLHIAFEEVVKKAGERGIRVTGSEVVGMLPLKVMLDAGKYYLKKQGRSAGVSEEEIIHIAVKSLGLDDLYPFEPNKKIIEYSLADESKNPLINMNLRRFANETASESPAPGGGSIAAYTGALGIALAAMVANVSANKRGWEDRVSEMSDYAEKSQEIKDYLLRMVDEDTRSFQRIMESFSLPKSTEEEKQRRKEAIQDATKYAMQVPFQVMQKALESMDIIRVMAEKGNPNTVTDAGVGAMCARTSVISAFLNVKVNASGLEDKEYCEQILRKGEEMVSQARKNEEEIMEIVNRVLEQ